MQSPLNITISKQRCKNKQIPVYKTQNFQVSITIAVTVQKKLWLYGNSIVTLYKLYSMWFADLGFDSDTTPIILWSSKPQKPDGTLQKQ